MTIEKAIKRYKQQLKDSQTVLEELESEVQKLTAMEDARHDAELEYEAASSKLEGVAFERDRVRGELHEATILQDPRAQSLRDRYIELTDREQALMDAMGDATQAIEQNTPDDATVAELTTRLKTFRTPSASEVVKAIKELEESHAKDVQECIQATLDQLPTPDPRTTHAALMQLDEGYRKNDGASLEQYLRDEDDKGRSEQATAMLASRLEARDRRAVVAARR